MEVGRNELLNFLLESDLNIWVYDLEADAYHFLNEQDPLAHLDIEKTGSFAYIGEKLGEELSHRLKEAFEQKAVTAETSLRTEVYLKGKDKTYTYLLSAYPFEFSQEGRLLKVIGTLVDVGLLNETQENLMEKLSKLEEALKVKDQFLSHVSHELRTPLNGISGMMQLLYLTKLDSEQKEYLRVLRAASGKMSRLINNLIQYTLLFSQNTGEIIHKKIFLRDLFRQILDTQKSDLMDKQLIVEISISPRVDGELLLDASNLEIVLDQIIDNAIKFSREGQIFINASADETLSHKLNIQVIDEGVGFNPKELHGESQEVYPVETNLTKQFGGLGLGLPILKKICEQSGIHFEIESKKGFGTRVTVVLDYALDEDAMSFKPEKLQPLKTKKALVVDDDENGRVLLSLLCKKSGLETEVATGGREAIEKAEQTRFDLIFLDIQMPEINGMEVLRHIRGGTVNRDVPIIAVTAYALKEDEERFLSSGFDGYIAKPVEFNRFEQTTKKVLQARY